MAAGVDRSKAGSASATAAADGSSPSTTAEGAQAHARVRTGRARPRDRRRPSHSSSAASVGPDVPTTNQTPEARPWAIATASGTQLRRSVTTANNHRSVPVRVACGRTGVWEVVIGSQGRRHRCAAWLPVPPFYDPGRSDFPSPVLTWALHTMCQRTGLPTGAEAAVRSDHTVLLLVAPVVSAPIPSSWPTRLHRPLGVSEHPAPGAIQLYR